MWKVNCIRISLLVFLLLHTLLIKAQLFSPDADYVEQTQYPVFGETDNIFIFCTDEGVASGSITAESNLSGTNLFEWEIYNPETGDFDFISSESTDAGFSRQDNLEDGCYQVTISDGEISLVYRAWVMNNWIVASGSEGESNCEYFQLIGTFISAQLKYYDLIDNSEIELSKNLQVLWELNDSVVGRTNTPKIYNPPFEDTDYTYTVKDRFGCETFTTVTYHSIVTKAEFTAEPMTGEAPLEVVFTNTSLNGSPGEYEWFFYRDLEDIKDEAEVSTEPIDSIMDYGYNENPVYIYENTGIYMVKLISKHISENHICIDTFYLDEYIIADVSSIEVPNVFTPNGDGVNDEFLVKYWSMKEIKISLFNRWGRLIHVWENNDVRGFEETRVESVWDGKIGGSYASPGVYYYVIEGIGRDDEVQKAHGFFHLFRER